jgi:hypothetical protein
MKFDLRKGVNTMREKDEAPAPKKEGYSRYNLL